jgi:hypothetical protein
MSIDIEMDTRWETVADEWDFYYGKDPDSIVWFEMDTNEDRYMMVDISHHDYVWDVQTKFDTLDTTYTVKMRVAWSDSNGVIPGLESQWNLIIIDSGEPNGCEEALVTKDSQVHDFILSFGDVTDLEVEDIAPVTVTLENAIETSSATKGCYAQYKL